MNVTERVQALATSTQVILDHLEKGQVLTQKELTPHVKEFLFEHFILNEGFEQFDEGRAMIIDESSTFLGLINVEDHIHVHLFEKSFNWDAAYHRLNDLDKHIGQSMEFAFSDRFGHLTADPMVCGTGLVVQTFLHVPALIHTESFAEVVCNLGSDVIVRGLGKEDEYIADLVLIENKFKLGVTEPDILKSVHKAAETLCTAEEKARKKLRSEGQPQIKDLVGRAFGILRHAHSLQIEEALTSLSLLELGRQVGWVEGGDRLDFKKSFFSTRRAHLHESLSSKEQIPKADLIIRRADLIHNELESARLSL